jgi:outer membrane protein assembly factor BamB
MTYLSALLGLLMAARLVGASDWPQFRGKGGTGVSTEIGLPTYWSPTENIRWKTALPGRGVSSPVVAGGRVYVTACSGAAEDRLHVLCFDITSGKQLWARQFWATGPTICHPKTCMAAPTPVAADGRVYALFASGDLFCLDPDGLLVWCRTLAHDYPAITNHSGMASSPVLVGETLVVPMENPGDSFVVGIATSTGKNRWRIGRPRDNSWTTPLVWTRQGRTELVLQSGPKLSAHDPQTGRERWSWSEKELAKIPSPVAAEGLVLVPSRDELIALRPDEGAEPTAQLAWRSAKLKPTTATPLVHRGRVYVVNSVGILTCADIASGKVFWRERVKEPFSASPVLANDRLYLVNEDGVTTVVQLGDEPHILGANSVDEGVLATPAVASGALILRSDKHLFCVGSSRP